MSDVDKSEHDLGDLLSSLDEDSEHGIGLLTGQQQHFARSGSKLTCYLTYAAIAVLWILSLVSAVSLSSRGCSKDGFAAGFDTDLGESQVHRLTVQGHTIGLTLRGRTATCCTRSRED